MKKALRFLLPLMLAGPAAAQPQPGPWVAYAAGFGSGTITQSPNPGEVYVGQGGGRYPIFSMRLLEGTGTRHTAEVLSPRSFDRYELLARDVDEENWSDDPHGLAQAAHERLEASIDHHRPATTFLLTPDGRVRVRMSPFARTFSQCARRLIARSSARLIETAEAPQYRDRERRRHPLRMALAEQPRTAPSLLLQLLHIPLQSMTGGRWSEFERQRTRDPADPPDQYSWRSEQIRLHGREAALEIDLMTDRSSPAARVCRSVRPHRVGTPARDSCRINAYLDARDGWPIVISIGRSQVATNGATSGWSASFYRLAPLEGFAPPENPCPA